jgi:signal transduction histidine kinase
MRRDWNILEPQSPPENSEATDLKPRDLLTPNQIAVAEERNRLAREIPDTLAQSFAGILQDTEALGAFGGVNGPRSEKALSNIKRLARYGLKEARRSVAALRPKPLEKHPLLEALKLEAKRLSKESKLSCQFERRGKILKLPTEVESELFRIFQEAMINVRKHALAKAAWITLEFKARQIIFTMRDNGIGFAATNFPERKPSYGLATMRERVERIGGQLEIAMPPTGGCAVRVVLPL